LFLKESKFEERWDFIKRMAFDQQLEKRGNFKTWQTFRTVHDFGKSTGARTAWCFR